MKNERMILRPGQIGKLRIRNRIVMLPMGTRFADKAGFVTDQTINYYKERAKGGAGLIIVEVNSVDSPAGNAIENSLVIDDDKFIPGLRKLARSIKGHGAKAAIQIGHAGSAAHFKLTGVVPVAPSAIKRKGLYKTPRELSIPEIEHIIMCFADAAERAMHAGFDAVEIHGAHAYLISQFLSGAWNKRTDRYGGNIENRLTFLKNIIKAVKEKVGNDYPIWCRINGVEEGIRGGTTLEEAIHVAKKIEGSVNALSVSAIASGAYSYLKTSPDFIGALLPLARAVKEVVDIPVIAAGRMTPSLGDEALAGNMADFIGFGRSLISDPYLPQKVVEGKTDDIRPCIACLNCYNLGALTCTVNPCVGNEMKLRVSRTSTPKKIFVVGGGPSGMEAARISALIGHQVTLFEKSHELGGQLLLAHIPPHKNRMIEPLTKYYLSQLKKLNIKVELGKVCSFNRIEDNKPDAVILATGIIPFTPDIPGIENKKVINALDVLDGKSSPGNKVVIIGGELVACETADFLLSIGIKVCLVRRGPKMAVKLQAGRRLFLLDRLSSQDATMMNNVSYNKIIDEGLVITDVDGRQRLIEADNIIIATGSRPNIELLKEVEQKAAWCKVLQIGDCLSPRGIKEAIEEGFQAAFLS